MTVESTGADLLENDSTFHTDVDRELFENVPLESSVLVGQLAGDADHPGRGGRF